MSDEHDDIEQRLRDSLGRATPEPPVDGGRAEAARRYASHVRRTKALSAIGAAAAVVAAAVVVPTVLVSGNGGGNVATGPTGPTAALPTPHVAHPFRCPAPGHPAPPPAPAANGVVPTDAVLARLCTTGVGGWVSSGPVIQQPAQVLATAPQEPLVTNVDKLVRDVNGLPPQRVPVACPLSIQPVGYSIVFQYADGHAVPVYGTTQGCDQVVTGPLRRSGAGPLLREYLSLLDQQRRHYAPPTGVSVATRCPVTAPTSASPTIVVDHRNLGLRSATACSYMWNASLATSGGLSRRQIRMVESDLAQHATHKSPTVLQQKCAQMHGAANTVVLAGTDRWGNAVDLVDMCSGYELTDLAGTWYWSPTPATQRMLAYALKLPGKPNATLTEPPQLGSISGRLLAVGGPAGVAPRPLPGQVQFVRGDVVKSIAVGKTGRFKAGLFPGRYRVVGHSPSYQSGKATCEPTHPYITVRARELTKVDVYCQEK